MSIYRALKTGIFVGFMLCLGSVASAFDVQTLKDHCERIPSNYSEYASENCPDITVIGSCINHTGYFGISSNEEFGGFARFTLEKLKTCEAACEAQDFGACQILGGVLSNGSPMYLSPKDNTDKLAYDNSGYAYFDMACDGQIVDGCKEAALLANNYWAGLRDHPSAMKTDCDYDDAGVLCEKEQAVNSRVDDNNWFTESPMEFHIKGCALDDAFSCKQAFEFATRYPDLVDEDVDPEYYRKRACDIGIKLFKCD